MIALLFVAALPHAGFDALVKELPALERAARSDRPVLTPALVRLGPSALPAMLDALKRPSPRALRLSVIEAVGILREPSAQQALFDVLEAAEDFDTARLAAEAIGRLGSDAARDKLLAASRTAQRQAVLAGMGQCRREAIARALDAALDGSQHPVAAKQIVRALSDVGNAAAWKLARAHQEDEAKTRAVAAAALVRAFVTYADEETRTAASSAILVVDAPETASLIADARRMADGDTAAALEALTARLARNPLR